MWSHNFLPKRLRKIGSWFLVLALLAGALFLSGCGSDNKTTDGTSATIQKGQVDLGVVYAETINADEAKSYQFTSQNMERHAIYLYGIDPLNHILEVTSNRSDMSITCSGETDWLECACSESMPGMGMGSNDSFGFSITEKAGQATTFNILVMEGFTSEGTIQAPIILTLGSTHQGEVLDLSSYYQFTTLDSGVYTVTLTASSAAINISPNLTHQVTSATIAGVCSSTGVTDQTECLFSNLAATTGYLFTIARETGPPTDYPYTYDLTVAQ